MSRSVQSTEPDLKHKIGSVLRAIYLSLFMAIFGGGLLSTLSPETFTSLTTPITGFLDRLFPSVEPHKWTYVAFALMLLSVAAQATFFPTRKQKEAADAYEDVYKTLKAARDELERAGLGKSEAARDLDRKLRQLTHPD